jgi:hypothetical protein
VTAKLLVQTTLVMINALKEPKHLDKTWATDNTEPNCVAITLDTGLVTKAFEKVKTMLTHVQGMMGALRVYIIRHQLIPDNEDDDPPFGKGDTKYNSIDQEMTARAPILTN